MKSDLSMLSEILTVLHTDALENDYTKQDLLTALALRLDPKWVTDRDRSTIRNLVQHSTVNGVDPIKMIGYITNLIDRLSKVPYDSSRLTAIEVEGSIDLAEITLTSDMYFKRSDSLYGLNRRPMEVAHNLLFGDDEYFEILLIESDYAKVQAEREAAIERAKEMHSPDPRGTNKELAKYLEITPAKVRKLRGKGELDAFITSKYPQTLQA